MRSGGLGGREGGGKGGGRANSPRRGGWGGGATGGVRSPAVGRSGGSRWAATVSGASGVGRAQRTASGGRSHVCSYKPTTVYPHRSSTRGSRLPTTHPATAAVGTPIHASPPSATLSISSQPREAVFRSGTRTAAALHPAWPNSGVALAPPRRHRERGTHAEMDYVIRPFLPPLDVCCSSWGEPGRSTQVDDARLAWAAGGVRG